MLCYSVPDLRDKSGLRSMIAGRANINCKGSRALKDDQDDQDGHRRRRRRMHMSMNIDDQTPSRQGHR